MVCNILSKMNEHPKFDMLKKCEVLIDENDISGYIKMTDNIIDKVEDLEKIQKPKTEKDKQLNKNIDEAKILLGRIKSRDIYRFVKSCQTFFDGDS